MYDVVEIGEKIRECVSFAVTKFFYEPATENTLRQLAQEISGRTQSAVGLPAEAYVDDMLDLEPRCAECQVCRSSSSYAEYKLKKAAANLPDEAGSEEEWLRMSRYAPGAVLVNVEVRRPDGGKPLKYTVSLST